MGGVGNYLEPEITALLHMSGGGVEGLAQISPIFLDFTNEN